MGEHKKLYRLLQLIALLKGESAYSVDRLALRFDTTERTIYRYLGLLRDCGFELAHTSNHRYYIVSHESDPGKLFAGFSLEEAGILKETLMAVYPKHPLKDALLKKLNTLTDLDHVADLIYDRMLARNISRISQGIQEQRRLKLVRYHAIHSGVISDRVVEPIGFTPNMRYLLAYDMERGALRQFKPERMEQVEVLDSPLVHVQEPDRLYPDRFGMNGTPVCEVTLQLSDRAWQLLQEEYPDPGNHQGNWKEEYWQLGIPVKGFEGIGRFVLGLPGEVLVVDPPEFRHYLEAKIQLFGTAKSLLKKGNF